mmetsp:Transcript_11567/g.16987  ORF Transcript_11567/g.16987 Transcript_11567/m.16987 type:complete len:351 (-) Transcript_11567:68-1120(-)|eukprot:CAMPEP_0194241892 /NCGR_PEP_ID=MMETSP0158-20130606/7611_1 /TAXON_ID=33649 /ORGANISM="Thalassionema nitzschioides, Strain L26-B" /LENGTH=350 /DNA_ID=CAMNT_0038976879 /DNA_START=143 /DNA_END=1195 /DNA_ORIENTATION=-
MGNSESVEEVDEFEKFDGIETLGYRVLGVQPNSPASQAGLVSFFDFMVGANGKMLLGSGEGLEDGDEYDDVDLPALLKDSLGKKVELLVYNIKSEQTRLVNLTPSDSWGGAGLLGVTIRLDNYGGADERAIRVLTVERNSPAAIAGLVPEQDYLLGTVSDSLEDTQALADLLMAHMDKVVELYVYNTRSDVVRVVPIMPTFSWGGGGLLGAEVGTGYLHRLPHAARSTSGTSLERKVRYVDRKPGSLNSPPAGNLEHEPQLEMESEGDGPVTLASLDDVSDTKKTDHAAATTNGANGVESQNQEIRNDKANSKKETIERSALPMGDSSNNEAAALFAGPPPGDHNDIDLR